MKFGSSLIAILGFIGLVGLLSLVKPTSGSGQVPGAQVRDVNVVNTPLVNVANTATNPVPVRDVDNGRQPFHESPIFNVPAGETFITQPIFTVPAGKRCIIESISILASVDDAATPNELAVITRLGTKDAFHELSVSEQGTQLFGNKLYAGTHSMRAYADPGTEVHFTFSRHPNTVNAPARVTISGYFVDVA